MFEPDLGLRRQTESLDQPWTTCLFEADPTGEVTSTPAVRRQKTIAAGFLHLESVDYRDVELLKAQDTFCEGSDFGCAPQHQTLIRASQR